jgi:hypothetical protein
MTNQPGQGHSGQGSNDKSTNVGQQQGNDKSGKSGQQQQSHSGPGQHGNTGKGSQQEPAGQNR